MQNLTLRILVSAGFWFHFDNCMGFKSNSAEVCPVSKPVAYVHLTDLWV